MCDAPWQSDAHSFEDIVKKIFKDSSLNPDSPDEKSILRNIIKTALATDEFDELIGCSSHGLAISNYPDLVTHVEQQYLQHQSNNSITDESESDEVSSLSSLSSIELINNTETNVSLFSLEGKIFEFSDVLPAQDFEHLRQFASQLNFQDSPSFVYNTAQQEDQLDTTVRESQTLTSTDPNLLSFIEDLLLPKLAAKSAPTPLLFKLARNYLTFIKYEPGGFFDWHVDFEKIRVNGGQRFKEMHLLFCLEGATEGGHLQIDKSTTTGSNSEKAQILSFNQATTANSCLIFDKLLKHRAAPVQAGNKIIMTIDVFVTTPIREAAQCLAEKPQQQLEQMLTDPEQCYTTSSPEEFKTALKVALQALPPGKQLVPFYQVKADFTNSAITELRFNVGLDGCSEAYATPDSRVCNCADCAFRPHLCLDITDTNDPVSKISDLIDSEKSIGEYSDNWHLVNGEQIYVRNTPNIPTLSELLGADATSNPHLSSFKSLPSTFDYNWIEKGEGEIGYSYHCNESNYDSIDIYYRFGLTLSSPLMQESPAVACFRKESYKSFESVYFRFDDEDNDVLRNWHKGKMLLEKMPLPPNPDEEAEASTDWPGEIIFKNVLGKYLCQFAQQLRQKQINLDEIWIESY